MGFPVGYSELFLPKPLLHTLSVLCFIRKFISRIFRYLGLGDFFEPDISWPDQPANLPELQSVSAVLLREILPVVKFQDLVTDGEGDTPENCAVCFYEFEDEEEIRRLKNCRHVFHRSCLDRWMDHDQKTCPLCRSPFIPNEMMDTFNERLWAASAILDLFSEYFSIPGLYH